MRFYQLQTNTFADEILGFQESALTEKFWVLHTVVYVILGVPAVTPPDLKKSKSVLNPRSSGFILSKTEPKWN